MNQFEVGDRVRKIVTDEIGTIEKVLGEYLIVRFHGPANGPDGNLPETFLEYLRSYELQPHVTLGEIPSENLANATNLSREP